MTDNQPKSPFPGMDPYMESRWADIHARLIVYASNQLNSQLPGDLSARIEETLTVEEDDNESRRKHIESIDPAGRVITAIEFLSPRNKIGVQARRKYGQKQDELIRGGVNLVEIDLIR